MVLQKYYFWLFYICIIVLGQQQAAMFFRSEPNWELQENLKEIGQYTPMKQMIHKVYC